MGSISKEEIIEYIENNISNFHDRRIISLENVKLFKILTRKNPYLFKAKNINTAQELIKSLLDAHLSSQEEGIFGEFLEGLSIFINSKIYRGWKSGIRGIDLEFDKERIRYIVTIKSGPNWGNAGQIKDMINDFNNARKTLKTSGSSIQIVAVNGCCYGKSTTKNMYKAKGDYYKYSGQKFWELISGDDNLYVDIIEPLGYKAKQKNTKFYQEYDKIINLFTKEILNNYCDSSGNILWDKIIQLNSGFKKIS